MQKQRVLNSVCVCFDMNKDDRVDFSQNEYIRCFPYSETRKC